jgi:hypothetical protein
MRTGRRWATVGVVAIAAVLVPLAGGVVPARSSDLTATDVLDLVDESRSIGWSGDVSTRGTLSIPDTDSFAGVARLLGEEQDVRAWWRDPEHWRVDRVRATGETDLVREGDRVTSWVFESATATVAPYSSVRLPDVSDLLPNQLADRLLDGATDDELSRLPSRRVAGRDAVGLRLEPAGSATTIDQVDLWADASTGLPLLVEVSGTGSGRPVLTSEVTRLDTDRPSTDDVTFTPAPDAKVRTRDAVDLAAGANVFAPFVLPDSAGGLDRRGDPAELGAVGVYGRGPTALVAVPLRRDVVGAVRDQLSKAVSAEQTSAGTSLTVGPLSVLLTDGPRGRGTFLLAGTVTPQTLADAADELADQVRVQS